MKLRKSGKISEYSGILRNTQDTQEYSGLINIVIKMALAKASALNRMVKIADLCGLVIKKRIILNL